MQSASFKSENPSPSIANHSSQFIKTSGSEYSNYDKMSPMHTEGYSGLPQYNQDMYYQPHTSYPLQHHLYVPTSYQPQYPNINQNSSGNFFQPNDLQQSLQQKSEAALQVLPASSLPELVHVYHSLVPLDKNFGESGRVFGHPSWVYKACSNTNGKYYALRRIQGIRLGGEKAMSFVKKWEKLCFPSSSKKKPNTNAMNISSAHGSTTDTSAHTGSSYLSSNSCSNSSIVGLKEAFTTRDFGDCSLIFVYEYYPNSQTLMSLHFGADSYYQQMKAMVPEKLIWSYLTQILIALKAIHGSNLAARVIDPSHILVTDKNRVRLNGCGIFDVLDYENGNNHFNNVNTEAENQESAAMVLERYQQEDILNLGKLILCLCNSSLGASQYIKNSLKVVSQVFSQDLYMFLKYILDSDTDGSEVTSASYPAHHLVSAQEKLSYLITLASAQTLDVFNDSLSYNSILNNALSAELENSRLVRLLCKLGSIDERPEYDEDPAWSEIGAKYPLRLFRDYVFHQTDDLGEPVVDLAYMLRELNKLDAGIDEKVMLMDRVNQTFMIVSYKELKELARSAFRDLKSGKSGVSTMQSQQHLTAGIQSSNNTASLSSPQLSLQQQKQYDAY